MHALTHARVSRNADYHARLFEHYRDRHEENQKALREQQRSARREVREAKKGDKDEAREEAAEVVAEVEAVLTTEQQLMELHKAAYDDLRAALDDAIVVPAIVKARDTHPVRRQPPRPRPTARRLQ